MSPATRELHQTLIRLLKGCISAWEKWLGKQKEEQQQEQHDKQ